MSDSNNINNLPSIAEDETSLKEIILKIRGWIGYLKTKSLMIFLIGIIGGGIGFVYALYKKPIYTATLTFSVEEEKSASGGLGGALGLASTLGFDLGGVSGGGIFSGANLIELIKSRSLVEKALLSPITINNKKKSLATFYIEFYGLNKNWNEEPKLKNIQFEPFADRTKFTLQQDSILGKIYEKIIKPDGALLVSQKDKKVVIITIEVNTISEVFSKNFAEALVNVVSNFYIETKTKKAKYNYEILQKQTDSIRNELNMAINGVARANDYTYNLNPALNVERTTSAKRQVDVQANTAILTQLVANLEMSKVSLRKETPLIQIIDIPILPLKKDKVSKVISFLLGWLLSAGLCVFVLFIKRIWKKIMAE